MKLNVHMLVFLYVHLHLYGTKTIVQFQKPKVYFGINKNVDVNQCVYARINMEVVHVPYR